MGRRCATVVVTKQFLGCEPVLLVTPFRTAFLDPQEIRGMLNLGFRWPVQDLRIVECGGFHGGGG